MEFKRTVRVGLLHCSLSCKDRWESNCIRLVYNGLGFPFFILFGFPANIFSVTSEKMYEYRAEIFSELCWNLKSSPSPQGFKRKKVNFKMTIRKILSNFRPLFFSIKITQSLMNTNRFSKVPFIWPPNRLLLCTSPSISLIWNLNSVQYPDTNWS